MRVTLTNVRLTPALVARIPGCTKKRLATWRRRAGRCGSVEEWCWAVRRHVPGRKWRPACAAGAHAESPPPAQAAAAVPTTRPNPRAPVPFAQHVRYLVLRQLGREDVGARGNTRIDYRAGAALEPSLLLLPGYAQVHGPGHPDPSDRPLGSAVRRFEAPSGQGLFNHLRVAPSVAVDRSKVVTNVFV